jgi:ABC-2 type transport system permease protein
MLLAPTTYFVILAQAIFFRGANITTVWPQFLALGMVGVSFFLIAAVQFRKSVTQNG